MFSTDEFLVQYGRARGYEIPQVEQPDPPKPMKPQITADMRRAVGNDVLLSSPADLAAYLQRLCQRATGVATALPGSTPSGILPASSREPAFAVAVAATQIPKSYRCLHLIYAYLIENTRIYELFGRVIDGFVHGERFGVAKAGSLQWLKTTEAMFYRQTSAHDHQSALALTSDLRNDGRAIRRNAYFRMFGMDLNHGTDSNQPYPYQKPKVSNTAFVQTLESLLRELWIAFIHQATDGTNPTDDGAVQNYARQLREMLNNRRLNGTLSIEELSAIATLDWLRLTISINSPIVEDLRAEATSEAERLQKIAERVGLPHHGKSEDYFELAGPMAGFLLQIEDGTLTDVASFLGLGQQLQTIITHWSSATGKVLKRLPQQIATPTAA